MKDETLEKKLTKYIKDNETFNHLNIEPVKLFIDTNIEDSSLKLKYYAVPIKYEQGANQEIN